MTSAVLRRVLIQTGSVLVLLAVFASPLSPPSLAAPLPDATAATSAVSETPSFIHLHGSVLDQAGSPIAAYVEVFDLQSQVVGSAYTAGDGSYDLTVPGRESLAVTATPLGTPGQTVEIDGGFQLSRYFELTRATDFVTAEMQFDFVLPPASHLWLWAYTLGGDRLLMGELYSQLNPAWYGYDDIYGVFPIESIGLPVPTGASIGKLRPAGRPDTEWGQSEPCFAVPPGEAVFLMMPWPVLGIGYLPVRADNRGQGYTLGADQVTRINLVYEFAETEYRRALELKAAHEVKGHTFSSTIANELAGAASSLAAAREETDWRAQALLSYPALESSIRAKEQMTLEVADADIEARKLEWTVAVRDEAGRPLPYIQVSYRQSSSDFVLSYGNYLPFEPFLYPSFKAGKEMGFEYLYDQSCSWKDVSSAPGVYDFSEHDARLERAQAEGWKVVVSLDWLLPDYLPAWAEHLEFPEFKRHLREYVKKAVEHYRGRVKYLTVVHEPGPKSKSATRYLDLQFKSSYLWGLQPEELLDLMRTAFEAAREVDPEILLGYSAEPDYGLYQLIPLSWGGRFCPYAFLKMALESGVRPDWIGVELMCGVGQVPLDLSTVAGILQAYHDLSGLPVLIAELFPQPSRAEDYGLTGPAPRVHWHEGMTQQVQADWASSVSRIALGLPYVVGFQMMKNQPDDFGGDLPENPGIGTDYITNDFQRKKVYYATRDLFESWRGAGSRVTDATGQLSVTGLAGRWAITATAASGLQWTFELPLDARTDAVTLTLDTSQAVTGLQDLTTRAQEALDWSQGLGRELDYGGLRERLAQARAALSRGEYGSARASADRVLEATAITIDGDPGDWKGIPPIATAEPGGVQVDAPGIDLKALYGVVDDEYLYLMVEVYDPPVRLQPDGDPGGIWFPQFLFDLDTGEGKRHHVRTYLPYGGQMDVCRLSEPSGIQACLYTLAYGEALEFKVPLALLDNPSSISVCAFVMAAENGAEKGAKGFECSVDVLRPTFAVSLPLVAGR